MQWILLLSQLKRQQCHGYMSFVVSAKPRRGCWRYWLQKGWKLLVTPRASWFESTEVAPSHTLVTLNVFPQSRIVGGGEKALFTMESLFPMEVNLRFSCCKYVCTNFCLRDSLIFADFPAMGVVDCSSRWSLPLLCGFLWWSISKGRWPRDIVQQSANHPEGTI